MRAPPRSLRVVPAVLGTCAILLAGLPPAWAAAPARAGLVVTHDGRTRLFCLRLPATRISGKQLVEQSGLDQSWDGGALCRLDGTGPGSSGGCFGDYPDFWGYWRGDGRGGWRWSTVGADQTTVADGAVEAWAWGRGQDPGSHPKPAALRFADVCPGTASAAAPASSPRQAAQPLPLLPLAGAGGGLLALLGLAWWKRRRP